MFDFVGIGSVLVDDLAVLSSFPQPDEKVEIIKGQKQLGGPVPTTLRALSKLDLKCSFIGKVGDDAVGNLIKEELNYSNIDTSQMIKEKGSKSGYAQVWIDPKAQTRAIAYSSGTLSPLSHNEFDFENLPKAKFLHIDGRNHAVADGLLEQYRLDNTVISIDTGNFRDETIALIEYTDIAIMPKRFAVAMFGDDNLEELVVKCRNYFEKSRAIVITDGVNGSVCSFRDIIFKQKAFDIDVVDTTGAGDVHSAGIVYGFYNNWKVEDTLRFAAAMAAVKCTHLGNLYLPSNEDVFDFLERPSVFV